jgi:hypothetical protein
VPIPIGFSTAATGEIRIGFFDNDVEKAEELEERVTATLNAIARRQLFIVDVKNVDERNFPEDALAKLANELRVPLLRLDRPGDDVNETRSFVVKVMKVEGRWDEDIENKIKSEITRAFDIGKVGYCRFCRLLFSLLDTSPCIEYYHKGPRKPFPNGKLEERVVTGDEEVVYVNYSCCGRVPADGWCKEEVRPKHELDPKGQFSELLFDEIPVCPPNPKYE